MTYPKPTLRYKIRKSWPMTLMVVVQIIFYWGMCASKLHAEETQEDLYLKLVTPIDKVIFHMRNHQQDTSLPYKSYLADRLMSIRDDIIEFYNLYDDKAQTAYP